MQRPRLVFRCQYPTTEKLETSPRKMSTRPISVSCYVEDTAQLSSQHSSARMCTHVLTTALFHSKINFKWISYENVCILSAFGYSQRKFKLSKMRRSLVSLKLFITEQVIKINYMYDTLQAAVLFNVWQLPP